MSKRESEAAFQATLAARLKAAEAAPPGGMHMTSAPTGQSKSLDQLMEDNAPGVLAVSALPEPAFVSASPAGVVHYDIIERIAVQLVVDSPWQPRTKYDETELQALGQAMKDRGQDEPIKVRKLTDGQHELISGHRRIRAARLIGWSTIGATIVKMDDKEAELATLVSNETHIGLSDYERAKAYKQAIDHELAKDQKEVGRLFSCSQSRVSQCLTLYKLPEPILQLLDKYPDLIAYRHARAIMKLVSDFPAGEDAIVAAVESMIDRPDLEVDELRNLVEKALTPRRPRPKGIEPRVIGDKNGSSAFSVRLHERQIVINIEDGVDAEMAGKRTMAALREFAQTFELPEKEKFLKTKA